MRWGQVILAFIAGTFLGPWLMTMFTGKGKTATTGY